MGITVTLNPTTAAIVSPTGVIYYGLFEEAFDPKDHPCVPRKRFIHFGDLASCLTRIMDDAAACEGGILQGPNGYITPTEYLANWRRALATPCQFTSSIVKASFITINAEMRESVTKILAEYGILIERDEFSFSLSEYPRALQDLIEKAGFGLWKFTTGDVNSSLPAAWASYAPEGQESEPLLNKIVHFKSTCYCGTFYWEILPSGEIQTLGDETQAIESLIKRYAIPSEIARPGSAEHMISRVVTAVKSQSKELAGDKAISVFVNKAPDQWSNEDGTLLAQKLQRSVLSYTTTFNEVVRSDAYYILTRLPGSMIRF